jgi:hypothetical protein
MHPVLHGVSGIFQEDSSQLLRPIPHTLTLWDLLDGWPLGGVVFNGTKLGQSSVLFSPVPVRIVVIVLVVSV